MSREISSERVLVVSFLVNVLDVATNLFVALVTGSAVVFAEMAKGLADCAGAGLLLIGERRAKLPSNRSYPFGYAREAFFWGLLSAVAMLVVGGGLSAWGGYQQLVRPEPIDVPALAIAVLVLSVATNGYAVSLSARKIRASGEPLREAFRSQDRPLVKGAFLRDAAGTTTSVLGLAAMVLYQAFGTILFDSVGALAAALLMSAGSILLMSQARALIAGHALPDDDLIRLRTVIEGAPNVEAVNRLAAVYVGPSEILVDADLDLAEGLDTLKIEAILDDVEARVRNLMPETEQVRILLNSPDEPDLPTPGRGRRG